MAVNLISGKMLSPNLSRAGVNLTVETDLLSIDVTNLRIGINKLAPAVALDVVGSMVVTGSGTVGNIITASSQIQASTGDLVLTSLSNNVSVNSKRIIACADPVDLTDVVNRQYLDAQITASLGGTTDTIIADNSSVVVVDDGVSAGFVQFTIDAVGIGTLDATTLTVPALNTGGAVTGGTGVFSEITIGDGAGYNITAGGTDRIDIIATSVKPASGLGSSRMLYLNGSGFLNTSANITVNGGNALTINDITINTVGITSNLADGDLILATDAGLVDVTGTSAIQLPSGTTAQRPGTATTAATAILEVYEYTIATAGTTDFTLYGAANSTPGTVFTADFLLTGSIDPTASTAVVGVGTLFLTELEVGSTFIVSGQERTVATITDNLNLTVTAAFTDVANDTSPEITTTGAGTGTVSRTITAYAGMTRWNSTTTEVEWYDGTVWNGVASSFVATSQQFTPTAAQTVFTLNKSVTTDSILVVINGIVQDPDSGTVYAVTSGTTLTFTTGLLVTDLLSIRYIAA